jgi:hypothetical protein
MYVLFWVFKQQQKKQNTDFLKNKKNIQIFLIKETKKNRFTSFKFAFRCLLIKFFTTFFSCESMKYK